MDEQAIERIVRQIVGGGTRRGVLRLLASLSLGGALGERAGPGETAAKKKRKKRRKKKRKKKCGKVGGKPVKGKCCTGAVAVDSVCQKCDVCASGCDFSSPQGAVDAATSGATIAICPGTYREDLTINSVLTLVGAGDGEGSGDTILQGTGQTSAVTIGGGIVTLEHLHITGGSGNPDESGSGGGIHNAGTTELIGCSISGNTAEYGGGIFHAAGALTLTDCTVSGNDANTEGGGIYLLDLEGTLVLTGCSINGNTAVEGGGGIYNQGTLSLTESEISGNSTADNGGGIYNNGTVTLDAASRVTENTANSDGGGIYNNGGTVTLDNPNNVTGNTPNNCAGSAAVAQCSD